jgi:hypothetical protein
VAEQTACGWPHPLLRLNLSAYLCMAGHLLALKDPHGKPLSRRRLLEEYRIFFVAGSETTGELLLSTSALSPACMHAGWLKCMRLPICRAVPWAACDSTQAPETSCAGHTIAWTLWFLCQNPPAMAKLEAELDAAGLLKSATNPAPRPLTFSDIGHLKWLDACIKASRASVLAYRVCAQRASGAVVGSSRRGNSAQSLRMHVMILGEMTDIQQDLHA